MKRIVLAVFTALLMVSCGGGGQENTTDKAKKENPKTEQKETVTQEAPETSEPKEVSLTLTTTGETMTDMQYEPKRLTVPAGAKVKLTLINEASSEAMIHNAVFITVGAQVEVSQAGLEAGPDKGYVPENDKIIAATGLANPGETVELEFTAPTEAGTYQFICTYPGHTAMKGILLVQ